jgi:ABC-type Fe3+/spermidine/putrescine transport system ATPase subunit
MQYELKEMQRKLGITSYMLPMIKKKAWTMSDTIVVMRDSVIFTDRNSFRDL